MGLVNVQVRTELQTIADKIATVENLIRDVPEIEDLHSTLFHEIPLWKMSLHAQLRSVVDAIDAQTPALQGIAGLRDAAIQAMQLLKPPGGAPGIGDVDQP